MSKIRSSKLLRLSYSYLGLPIPLPLGRWEGSIFFIFDLPSSVLQLYHASSQAIHPVRDIDAEGLFELRFV